MTSLGGRLCWTHCCWCCCVSPVWRLVCPSRRSTRVHCSPCSPGRAVQNINPIDGVQLLSALTVAVHWPDGQSLCIVQSAGAQQRSEHVSFRSTELLATIDDGLPDVRAINTLRQSQSINPSRQCERRRRPRTLDSIVRSLFVMFTGHRLTLRSVLTDATPSDVAKNNRTWRKRT